MATIASGPAVQPEEEEQHSRLLPGEDGGREGEDVLRFYPFDALGGYIAGKGLFEAWIVEKGCQGLELVLGGHAPVQPGKDIDAQ